MYLFSSSTTKFLHSQPPIKIPIQKRSNNLNFNQYRRNLRPFSRQPCAFFRKSDSNPTDKVIDSNVNSAEEDFVSRVLEENPLEPYAFFRKSDSNPTDKVRDSDVNLEEEDFVSRVLKENPCEVEPKYLIGGKLYSKEKKIPKKEKEKEKEKEKGKDLLEVKEKGEDLLEVKVKVKVKEKEKEKEKEKGNDLLEVKEKEKEKEKGEDLFEIKEKEEEKDPFEVKEKGEDLFEVKEKEKDLFEVKEKGDNLFEVKEKREDHFEVNEKGEDEKRWDFGDVKLKDMLKDFRGKLYVPEQAFGETLSEEEEFNRSFRSLPKMEFENFMEALGEGRIRFMTYKDDIGDGLKEFIFELDDIPTQNDIKSMQRTKWAMMLNENQAKDALDEYNGPRYMIETQLSKAWVTKLPEYPHSVASSISSRVIVEFGVLTASVAVAAAAVGGFLAWAVFVGTSFIFVAVYYTYPKCIAFVTPLPGLLASVIINLFIDLLTNLYTILSTILSTSLFTKALQVVIEDFTDWVIKGLLFRKIKATYFSFGLSDSLKLLGLIMILFPGTTLLMRLTISQRPKDFRRWDIFQGMEFSQSKAQARVDGSTGVTFKDVAGIDSAVEELQELVRYLKNPELFEKMGIKPPHGVLLEGPPGCGKTLIAKAIAGEAGVPFYQMAGSEFVEVLVGVGSARVRDLFKRAKANKPSVIFIDEIDALATRRQGIINKAKNYIYDAATQERETTLNQLLIELDGFDTGKGVIFLGATNRKDLLDPALLRPGRFDRKIRIFPPNAKGRLDILKVHARKVKMSDSVDLSSHAQNLPGWSGAKLAQLLQEAALVAVRNKHKSIIQSDLDEAVERLTVGPKVRGVYLDYRGQCRRALTEAGIAVVSHLLRLKEGANVERCDRISIHPRGETLSQIVFHRLDEELLMYERLPQLLQRIQVFIGGRAAEEVIFGRDTSVASAKYLAHASWLARKIISGWNLENPMVIHGETPPWREKTVFVGPRLDFEGSMYKTDGLSAPPLNFNMDDEIARRTEDLMLDMYDKTVSLLSQHNAALLKIVKVLVKQMEISGEEIDYILEHYPANTPASLILEEGDPGGLPLFHKQKEEQSQEAEYELLP